MANWLEEEEKKKALEDERIANEKLKLLTLKNKQIQDQIQIENDISNSLKAFHTLCDRVNQLKRQTLVITSRSIHVDRWTEKNDEESLKEHRKISFSATLSENVHIEVRQYREIHGRMGLIYNYFEKIHLEKNCSIQDLLDWPEEKMITIIQWLIFERDFLKENLPGVKGRFVDKGDSVLDWIWLQVRILNGSNFEK